MKIPPVCKSLAFMVVILLTGGGFIFGDDAAQTAIQTSVAAMQAEQSSTDAQFIFLMQVIAFSVGFIAGQFSWLLLHKSWLGKHFI